VKVALFCCLAGTHTPGLTGAPWGAQHWQQFLLLLHAAKQLTGGLWKPMLRDWASAGGALLPLQCVLDLLGNVYNASSLAVLEQQPALLGSRQLVLEAVASTGGSRAPSAAGGSSSRVSTPKAAQQGRPVTAAGQQLQSQLQAQLQAQRSGTVAAAVQELLVDGPLGAASAVDVDDLLAMLMVQFDAGAWLVGALSRDNNNLRAVVVAIWPVSWCFLSCVFDLMLCVWVPFCRPAATAPPDAAAAAHDRGPRQHHERLGQCRLRRRSWRAVKALGRAVSRGSAACPCCSSAGAAGVRELRCRPQ
jgi:hypothetical protein